MKQILIIAILLFGVCLVHADEGEDYLERYIQSRGGSIRYHEPEPQQSQETTINIYIEQTPPGYYRYDPAAEAIYYQQRYNTWRYGSPSDVKKFIFDERRRHHRWRR